MAWTRDELRDLATLYGFDLGDGDALMQAGAQRNLARRVERDGLRAIVLLARFCEPGEDPVRLLARLLQDAGYDLHTGWESDDM